VLITIDDHLTSSGSPVSISELTVGDIVRLKVQWNDSRRTDTVVYEVVYLPSDFPELIVTVLEDGVFPDALYVNLNGPSLNISPIKTTVP